MLLTIHHICHTGKKKCIIPTCSCISNITTTNICTAIEVATMLGLMTDNLDDTQTVMLCKSHYRQVHRLLHNNDTYVSIKFIQCYACNPNIQYDKDWQCPDPRAITEHYQVHYRGLSFTPDYRVCKSCCNSYSIILKMFQSSISSLDEEIQHLKQGASTVWWWNVGTLF